MGLTLEETLNHVLSINQSFYKVLNPRAIIVVPETPQKRAQYKEQVIRTFYVSHADVQELSQLLSTIMRVPQIAVQPTVIPNTLANAITVRATTAVAAIIEQVIAPNDKPGAEVIIDVATLEVNRERARRFGLNLTDYAFGGIFSPEVAPPNDAISPSGVSSPPPFNLNTISRGVSAAEFYLGVPAAVVRFLETDSHTRLVANPQLRGQEGQTMTLNLGEDIPVPQTAFTAIATAGAAVNPLTSFIYRPVGVTLEMTPRVTYENEIILDLLVENSTLGANIDVAGTSLPTFGSRKVQTRLRLRDGESNLLAGLLPEEDRSTLRGIPGIARVPLLRRLFGYTDEAIRQTDIVMLLTPRLVRGHELTQRDLSPIHIGTQTNFGLTGPPPLIAPQSDTGVSDAPEPDAITGAAAASPTGPSALTPVTTPSVGTADTSGGPPPSPGPDASPAETVAPAPTPPLDPVPGVVAAEPNASAAPVVPEPVLPPPSRLPQTPPARTDVSPAAQVVVTPPGSEFRVGGGPYMVPVSISGATQLSTISLTLFFDPSVVRVDKVELGSFMQQGGVQVTFRQQVDTAAGRVDITATRINDAMGAAGTGLLAAVHFSVVGAGSVLLRTLIKIKLPTSLGKQRVVPLAMEAIWDQGECVQLCVGNLGAGGVLARVELRVNPQARRRPRIADPVDDRLERLQRGAAPVLGDMAEEPMLDLVPLARPRRQVTDMDAEPRLIGELLQLHFPGAGAIAIAPARVRGDKEVSGLRIRAAAQALPPVTNRRDGEGGRIVVLAHADPCLVAGHVIDSVGNRFPARVRRKIVDTHLLRPTRRLPFSAPISEVPDQFFLFRVDQDDRLVMLQETVCRRTEVCTLRVAVGVRRAFVALPRCLQTVAQLVEEAAERRRTHPPPLLSQRGRQLRATLARPPQGRHGVAAGQRVHQRLQGVQETGLRVLKVRAPGAHAALPIGGRAAACQLPPASPNRQAREPGRRRHRRIAPVADGPRLRRRPHAATARVQDRRDRRVLPDKGGFQCEVSIHANSRLENRVKLVTLF